MFSANLRQPHLKRILFVIMMLFSTLAAAKASVLTQETLNLQIVLLSGQTVTLNQYINNKPVYIKFWAGYCKECIEQMPHLEQAYKKYGNSVQVIAVNLGVDDDEVSVNSVKKKFGLTVPIAIDKSGKLAQAFNLMATPYHVLIDKKGRIIIADYVKTVNIDKQIALISEGGITDAEKSALLSPALKSIDLGDITTKPTALFFVSTWCDWYLKDSRPAASQNCISAQKYVNALAAKHPQINWIGVATRLWTEAPELAEYKKKFKVKHRLMIDITNDVTFEYGVKNYPTLILLNNGKEIFRTQKIQSEEITKKIKSLSSKSL